MNASITSQTHKTHRHTHIYHIQTHTKTACLGAVIEHKKHKHTPRTPAGYTPTIPYKHTHARHAHTCTRTHAHANMHRRAHAHAHADILTHTHILTPDPTLTEADLLFVIAVVVVI